MTPQQDPENTATFPRSTHGNVFGFVVCVCAELFYVVSNTLLRWMTNYPEVSSDWTLMVKESVTIVSTLIIIVVLMARRRYRFPSLKLIGGIVLAAIFCQLVGARSHLWAYAQIGMVLTIPLILTFQLLLVSGLGVVCLKEKMSWLKIVTMCVLVTAILILAASQLIDGKLHEIPTVGQASFGMHFLFGMLICFLAGLGYALYLLISRGVMKTDSTSKDSPDSNESTMTNESTTVNEDERPPMPITLCMFLICGVGFIVGASYLAAEKGWDGFWNVPGECWLIVLTCGVFNCIGFYFRNLSFQYVTASKMALLSTIQILLLAVLGILCFHEPTNGMVYIGLALTSIGIAMAGFTK